MPFMPWTTAEPRPYCRQHLVCEPHPLLHLQYWNFTPSHAAVLYAGSSVCTPWITTTSIETWVVQTILIHYNFICAWTCGRHQAVVDGPSHSTKFTVPLSPWHVTLTSRNTIFPHVQTPWCMWGFIYVIALTLSYPMTTIYGVIMVMDSP